MPFLRHENCVCGPAFRAAGNTGGALLSSAEDRCHHARAAASVHDRDNSQRTFIRRAGYEVIARVHETQWSRGEIGATMALMWKRNKRLDGRLDCIDHPIGCLGIVFGSKFPNRVEVDFSFRVKIVPSRH